ncbi:hypothetical protein CL614_04150 [archaeon]|nr:hypothetical protein [archaeon]
MRMPQKLRKRKGKSGLWYRRRNSGKEGSPKGKHMHWVKYSKKLDASIMAKTEAPKGSAYKHMGDRRRGLSSKSKTYRLFSDTV